MTAKSVPKCQRRKGTEPLRGGHFHPNITADRVGIVEKWKNDPKLTRKTADTFLLGKNCRIEKHCFARQVMLVRMRSETKEAWKKGDRGSIGGAF